MCSGFRLAFEPDPDGEGTVSTESRRRDVVHGRLRERITIGSLTMVDVPVIAGRGATWLLGGAFLKDHVTTFDQESRAVRFRRTSN
ncbi:MAG: hypothetical protein H6832_03090 [Planctomycetes bacterium]|nr:hypothetical protein [Planctomycetota bacterium]